MTTHQTSPAASEFDCVIVGGGIHGTYCCQRLLEDTPLDRSAVAILDPNERLLDSFRTKARACGMDSLRSTFVHHIGTDPFGLESFAEARDRTEELRPTVDYPDRPSLDLFVDHADHVIESNGLDTLHVRVAVEAIHERADGGLRLTTDDGMIDARACVLAIGHGGRVRLPDWAEGVDRATHVWDGFDPDADSERTVVVGGGITAAQLACELREPVTMLTRHPLQWELSEADPPWLNWRHIERKLHCHPPGSAARLAVVDEARYDATIPPHLYDEFRTRVDDQRLHIVQGEVETTASADGRLRLTLADGRRLTADRVVCATGFE
ncbi:MAG: FAD/NAD(P)-binding protein, partial [Halohasta sp.]